MVRRHRSPREKLEALTFVALGYKLVQIGKLLNIPDNTISTWTKNHPDLMEKARSIAPNAVRRAKRSAAARKGGLARWGKLDPMPISKADAKGAKPAKKVAAPKVEAKKSKEQLADARRAGMKRYWEGLTPEQQQARVDKMRSGLKKKA